LAPFKSESQRRKFYAMAERGEISKGKVAEYERETKKGLPEKVKSDENRAAAKAKAVKFKKKKEMIERGQSK
jgi:hypothetical protein